MWIKNNQVYKSQWEVRNACPNISFPASITDQMITDAGFEAVMQVTPTYDPITQSATETAPVKTNGIWTCEWTVVALTPEEVAAKKAESFTQAVTAFDTALTDHLDNTAKSKRYDNRITCMVRAGFAGPFQAEAIVFASWADTCNILAYQMLAQVQAGTQPMPASPQAFIATLPEIVWPG